jgi:uncharacterized protein YcfL
MKFLAALLALVLFAGCASMKHNSSSNDDDGGELLMDGEKPAGSVKRSSTVKSSTTTTSTTTKTSIVVDQKDLATLEKMNKALEAYVLKNKEVAFKSLCQDKRFDCFVDETLYPKGKKKATRSTPPYASGSKMGLNGEKRIQARYDFYP